MSAITNRVGLYNLGNTCYMNSALQMMIHCSDLSRIMKALDSKKPLIKAYHRLVNDYEEAKRAISPADVKDTVGEEFTTFRYFHQEDSHEFIIKFLDMLEEEMKIVIPEYANIVSRLFDCTMETSIRSKQSSQHSSKVEPVRFLSVPVYGGKRNRAVTLDSCFDAFCQTEEIQGWQTPKKGKERAIKKTSFKKYPRNLIFQLKRFSFHRHHGHKISTPVDVPASWTPDGKNWYRLKGFVHQSGSLSGGHYTSYMNLSDGWYHFNDSHVSRISEKKALQVAESAYLIYFVRE